MESFDFIANKTRAAAVPAHVLEVLPKEVKPLGSYPPLSLPLGLPDFPPPSGKTTRAAGRGGKHGRLERGAGQAEGAKRLRRRAGGGRRGGRPV